MSRVSNVFAAAIMLVVGAVLLDMLAPEGRAEAVWLSRAGVVAAGLLVTGMLALAWAMPRRFARWNARRTAARLASTPVDNSLRPSHVSALLGLSRALARCLAPGEVAAAAIEQVHAMYPSAQAGVFLMSEPVTRHLRAAAHFGFRSGITDLVVQPVETFLREALATRRPVTHASLVLPDDWTSLLVTSALGPEQSGEATVVAIPLSAGEAVTGCVALFSWRPAEELAHAGRTLLGEVGQELSVALDRAATYEHQRNLATKDHLTGAPNRRHLLECVDTEIKRSMRSGHPFSVLMIDLDDFKRLNDTYGHGVGDRMLVQLAVLLVASFRNTDYTGRYGGDEFLAVLPETDSQGARVAAERLLRMAKEIGFRPDNAGGVIPVGVSVGIAEFPTDSSQRDQLLELADSAMYLAKAAGGGCVRAASRVDTDIWDAKNATVNMLDGLVTAVDNKDHYTRVHSEDVARYAVQIAEVTHLSHDMCADVRIAALVHDVGKIGIPEQILGKPAGLTEAEFQVIKQHPRLGQIFVRQVQGLEEIAEAVLHHHERYDGTGYPSGLKQQQIPLVARILAVADGYSAMTTDRPYRKAMSMEKAIAELRRGAGTQWDPALVDKLLEYLDGRPVATTPAAVPARAHA